jgi:hypothetical protein
MPASGLPIRVYKEHDMWHVDYGEGETEDHTSREEAEGSPRRGGVGCSPPATPARGGRRPGLMRFECEHARLEAHEHELEPELMVNDFRFALRGA